MEQIIGILVKEQETIIWNPNNAQKECEKGTNTDTWNRDMKHSACWSSIRSWRAENIVTFYPISWKKNIGKHVAQNLHNFPRIQRDFFTLFYDKLKKKYMPYWLPRNSVVQTKCQSTPPLHYNTSCDSWQLTDVIAWWSSSFLLISKNLDRNLFLENRYLLKNNLLSIRHDV